MSKSPAAGEVEHEVDVKLDYKEHTSLSPHGLRILLVVGLLLVVREAFFVVTMNKVTQYKEHLFYPFAACTELVAVLLFLVPGLIPLKHEIAEATREDSNVSLSSSGRTPTY